MDREQLAQRNRTLTEKRHAMRRIERIRRIFLRVASRIPIPKAPHTHANTLLLIRPDHIGDALLTMPAILALRAALPEAKLIVLCGGWTAEVFAAYSEVDYAITLPFPGFVRGVGRSSLLAPYYKAWQWARQVRRLGAKTAVLFRPDHWWGGLLTKWAGIPHRIGYDTPDLAPFLTEAHRRTNSHTVLESVELVKRWIGNVPVTPTHLKAPFPFDSADRAVIDAVLLPEIPMDKPIVVIHPGAGTFYKTWGVEGWAWVADQLSERLNAGVVFTGSDREHETIFAVMDHMRHKSRSLAGETTLSQMAALYDRALVVLGPDTGPLHLAVSVGTPTVHLYGPADPDQFGPWGDPRRHIAVTSDIGCRPCRILDWRGDDPNNHPCIREIAPSVVLEAALRAIG
ncbi:MAG: glycosyltransferase family 9 protein [Anaerolineae bacterium]